jgi:hypothetical protein
LAGSFRLNGDRVWRLVACTQTGFRFDVFIVDEFARVNGDPGSIDQSTIERLSPPKEQNP